MPLRFHWRLPLGGETSGITRLTMSERVETGLPDLDAQVTFCKRAEDLGIDSLLIDFGASKPDPILLAAALGMATSRIKFIVAYRSGLISPTSFVQQLNTLSALIDGRFLLNIVAGYSSAEQMFYGDFLAHDERYERTGEFLTICRALWSGAEDPAFSGKYYRIGRGRLNTPFISSGRAFPEILVSGSSPPARKLALRQGTCWMRLADAPEVLRPLTMAVAEQGLDVGLRMSVICKRTREQAIRAAQELIQAESTASLALGAEKEFVNKTDSSSIKATFELAESEWLTSYLWTGAVRSHGAPSIALVGTAQEIASAIMEYKSIGVTQFIFSGWPKLDEMINFGRNVIPLVRDIEGSATEQRVCQSKVPESMEEAVRS
jgi:alkanesulfonate monooxygenase